MTGWRFYGRDSELAELELSLRLHEDTRRFGAIRIIGRRGIGKTEFMKEAARRGTGDPPVLHVELPSPELGDAAAACDRLIDAASSADLKAVFGSLPERQSFHNDMMWFGLHLKELIAVGAIVVLDEFHHARPLGLVSDVKLVIDGFTSVAAPKVAGKLVMMGSHQQQLLRMFHSDQPLYGRATSTVRLPPWQAGTVLEMASEQGFLQHPARFLTLWSAFGGVPKHWRRFTEDDRATNLSNFLLWPDDSAWRKAFIDNECELLVDPEERFDSSSFVELAPQPREVLLWLANNRPRGATTQELQDKLNRSGDQAILDALRVLQRHLELVEPKGQFNVKGAGRWRIIDNRTLFQITAFPEMFDTGETRLAEVDFDSDGDRRMAAVAENEGLTLERLAAACFGELPDISWSRDGVWRQRRSPPFVDSNGLKLPPLADIDVMALRGKWRDPDTVLVLAGCKRNAGRHHPARLDAQFSAFLEDLGNEETATRLRALPQERFLVSPEFTDEQRLKARRAGFGCLGVRDLAHMLNIDPGPGPESRTDPRPAPVAPAPSKVPEPEDGPSLDM